MKLLKIFLKRKKAPIFILGCPRSGTTWLLEIFIHHPDIFHLNCENLNIPKLKSVWDNAESKETGIFNRYEFNDAVNIIDLAIVKNSKKGVEKTPSHVFYLEKIIKQWKTVPIVIYRNPFDNVLSIIKAGQSWAKHCLPTSIKLACKMWNQYVNATLKYNKKTMNIYYDDLKISSFEIVQNLFKLQGLRSDYSLVKDILNKTANGKSIMNMKGVYRKGVIGDHKQVFLKKEINQIDKLTNKNLSKIGNIFNKKEIINDI